MAHPHALVHPLKLVLSDFLNELKQLEERGLEQEQCDVVRSRLTAVIKHISSAQKPATWLSALKADFEIFLHEYATWNHSGDPSPSRHRAKHERELRKIRKAMQPHFPYGPLFATEQERKVFDSIYDELVGLGSIKSVIGQPSSSPFKKTVQRASEKRNKLAKAS
jgi:hypothetical protein